jgi:hypothetical protein
LAIEIDVSFQVNVATDMEETMDELGPAERIELIRLLKKVGMWAAARLDDKQ